MRKAHKTDDPSHVGRCCSGTQDQGCGAGQPQGFVSKAENGERGLDRVEHVSCARGIGAEPMAIRTAMVEMLKKGDVRD